MAAAGGLADRAARRTIEEIALASSSSRRRAVAPPSSARCRAVRAVAADQMPLVGLAVYGPKNAVDKIFKGLPLHP